MALAIREVTSPITDVMTIWVFFARSLIFVISINTAALGSTPGPVESNLAVSLVGWVVILPGSISLH